MSGILTKEEVLLLELLGASLTGEKAPADGPDPDELKMICGIAESHSVLPLLQPVLEGSGAENICRSAAEICAAQFYRLLILTRRCVQLLRDAGIETVVLKGPGTAWYYPVPEHRRSGDIDLLLADPGQLSDACRILCEDGAVPENEQHANHHVSLRIPEGIVVELHSSIVEAFDNQSANRLTAGAQKYLAEHHIEREILPGAEIPVPDEPGQAVSLLLHMLQHFLRAGFGLKLICDWAVLWERMPEDADMSVYENFLDECGLRGFADILGCICIRYLGLRPERVHITEKFDDMHCREFLREIFDAGAFGRTSSSRMVMVRSGPGGFVREFHHQMHLNFPRAGRWIPLWPALWGATLGRFLRNNRVLRKTSMADILGDARRRSRITEPLHLFERRR